ncbi:MSCRAMM family protein, partial [Streptomyces cinnamoneus]|uniref:MSCRAMM family protein n=1 Tax=Streptomyces cinnamoneus TaxID=53446 RepID=UPI003571523B
MPTPSASAAPTETPEPDTGSVSIVKKDPAGAVLPGAAFLLDAAGQEAGAGKTDAQGKLTFTGLAPGIHRLKIRGMWEWGAARRDVAPPVASRFTHRRRRGGARCLRPTRSASVRRARGTTHPGRCSRYGRGWWCGSRAGWVRPSRPIRRHGPVGCTTNPGRYS